MNERIRELLKQADDYADNLGLGGSEWCDAQVEKFAELIVRECLDIAITEECWAPYQGPVESEIRKHFGVEE